jgi:predicted transposase YdaD
MARGFSSLSKQQRSYVSRQGGKISQLKGKGHQLNSLEGSAAAVKSAASRRRKAVMRAAQILLEAGLTAEELDRLQLSEDEYIRYGGARRTATAFEELLARAGRAL